VSMYSVVSRGVVGRLGQRSSGGGTGSLLAPPQSLEVRWPGASMRVLEASLAFTAIATAILIGVGR
jgi:hypothetical protein